MNVNRIRIAWEAVAILAAVVVPLRIVEISQAHDLRAGMAGGAK